MTTGEGDVRQMAFDLTRSADTEIELSQIDNDGKVVAICISHEIYGPLTSSLHDQDRTSENTRNTGSIVAFVDSTTIALRRSALRRVKVAGIFTVEPFTRR